MPSPFPGVDPYLETSGSWPDFHASIITYIRDALLDHLPGRYVARIDEHIHLVSFLRDSMHPRPDVMIARGDAGPGQPGRSKSATATIEPVTISLPAREVREVRDMWIEIRRLPEHTLVTVIEILSPSNKAGNGRTEYLAKRVAFTDQPVHLVEIDLLVDGERLPMRDPLPRGDFYAIVSRSDRRPNSQVYAWTVRQPIPSVPIPLMAPDPDVSLDLGSLFATAYERGRYARSIDYAAPLELPLSAEDRAWAEALAKAGLPSQTG